jgi:hypothetical protein
MLNRRVSLIKTLEGLKINSKAKVEKASEVVDSDVEIEKRSLARRNYLLDATSLEATQK